MHKLQTQSQSTGCGWGFVEMRRVTHSISEKADCDMNYMSVIFVVQIDYSYLNKFTLIYTYMHYIEITLKDWIVPNISHSYIGFNQFLSYQQEKYAR